MDPFGEGEAVEWVGGWVARIGGGSWGGRREVGREEGIPIGISEKNVGNIKKG